MRAVRASCYFRDNPCFDINQYVALPACPGKSVSRARSRYSRGAQFRRGEHPTDSIGAVVPATQQFPLRSIRPFGQAVTDCSVGIVHLLGYRNIHRAAVEPRRSRSGEGTRDPARALLSIMLPVLMVGMVAVGALSAVAYRWWRNISSNEDDDFEVIT